MIDIEGVSKVLEGRKVLDNINLHINKGSIFGLIGPNGAGKTTLIKCIVGIYEIDNGKIIINNEIAKNNVNIRSIIGYVPDFIHFYPYFKVDDMIKFYRNTYYSWNDKRFEQLIKIFNIDTKKKIRNLSKGMKTQLSILLNLSIMPRILILDEPTSGLDPVIRKKVLNLIVDEVSQNQTTVFISTHNLGEVERICDHIGIIHEGKIIEEEKIEDLKNKIGKLQVVFKDTLPEEVKNHDDILKIEKRGRVYHIVVKDMKEMYTFIENYNPVILETINMDLEEIFLYKMGGEGYEFETNSI
ncbi:ABC-type multidrug transport system, ATPase component [Gottschalkia purinilytica]|uniref:ABC-type multidrug transport system, ATPase component n=1 Tax=Gottschalkia purinilytica TaxID=1503 RepID=A0A0L0WDH3_GOTPU|nr:ABC transporter ATP-binding protein [Gottschalkia purinilytica]KNF09522.1 ABC-type multidrug transport system, ATPase component [Gottschalkia purinilytica]